MRQRIERWLKRLGIGLAITVAMLVLYVLSIGPVLLLVPKMLPVTEEGMAIVIAIRDFYDPLLDSASIGSTVGRYGDKMIFVPCANQEHVSLLERYIDLWVPVDRPP